MAAATVFLINFLITGLFADTNLVDSESAVLTLKNGKLGEPVILTKNNLMLVQLEATKTVFVIHGLSENGNATYYPNFRDEYAKKGKYNVITVDWGSVSNEPYIIQVVLNTKVVGKQLADYILALKALGLSLKKVHLIGHSLGAHVAGFAGKEILQLSGKKVGRITALDAAGPAYEQLKFLASDQALNKYDAHFVDVIHTDAGKFGMENPIGKVDFYPNGGFAPQPGCLADNLETLMTLDGVACSHRRSVWYYVESINSRKFVAKKCNKSLLECDDNARTIYGEDSPQDISGSYYFETNDKSPFARGG